MKEIAEMSYSELVNECTGQLIISIGNGEFRDTVAQWVCSILQLGAERAKTSVKKKGKEHPTKGKTYLEIYNSYYVGNIEKGKLFLAKLTTAERVAWALLNDITDRRGWRQEWDQFDDDIKNEIFSKFVSLVETTK